MAFMQQQILYGTWIEAETSDGTDFIPADFGPVSLDLNKTYDDDSENWDEICAALRDYVRADLQEVKLIEGYGARLSAPGYMDCTDWSVFASEKEAREYLVEMYGDDEEDEDSEE